MPITLNGSGTITGVSSLATALVNPVVTTTMGVGNATPAATGSGITFPAAQSASSDANTLDDYEEGTWTPTDGSGAGLSFTVTNAVYTKIGKMVTLNAQITFPSTASVAIVTINGLPFTPTTGTATGALGTNNGSATVYVAVVASLTPTVYLRNTSNNNPTNITFSTSFLAFTITYPAS